MIYHYPEKIWKFATQKDAIPFLGCSYNSRYYCWDTRDRHHYTHAGKMHENGVLLIGKKIRNRVSYGHSHGCDVDISGKTLEENPKFVSPIERVGCFCYHFEVINPAILWLWEAIRSAPAHPRHSVCHAYHSMRP